MIRVRKEKSRSQTSYHSVVLILQVFAFTAGIIATIRRKVVDGSQQSSGVPSYGGDTCSLRSMIRVSRNYYEEAVVCSMFFFSIDYLNSRGRNLMYIHVPHLPNSNGASRRGITDHSANCDSKASLLSGHFAGDILMTSKQRRLSPQITIESLREHLFEEPSAPRSDPKAPNNVATGVSLSNLVS